MKFLLLGLLLPVIASAQSNGSSFSLAELTGALDGQALGPKVDCFDPAQTPVCGKITDQFCDNLGAGNGRVNDSTGTINIGKSQRSQLSEMERANLVDLTNALPALPPDLRAALQKPIQKLKSLIQSENDSKGWYKDVAKAREQIADKVQDVAKKRANASLRQRLRPGVKATSADIRAERDAQEKSLMETLTKAKTEASPNWSRIGSVYSKVKEDMLNVINTLPLTQEEKNARIQKINATKITHPFGVRMGGVLGDIIEQDCRTNMINAMYMPMTGSLTVCSGFLSGYQSENALYFTLAHELSHAFNMKQIQCDHSEPRWSKVDKKLLETNSNLSCDEYRRLVTEARAGGDNYDCGRPEYNTFMNCLNGNRPAPGPVSGNMMYVALGRVPFCEIADRNQGLAYMNPNEFADRRFAGFISGAAQEYTGPAIENARNMLMPAYTLAQEIRCQPAKTCAELEGGARARAAMGTTTPECIRNSERGSENEADWYAHKAMTLRLRSVSDIRERRQLVASSLGLFCPFSYMREPSDKDRKRMEKELAKMAEMGEYGGGSGDNHASNEERISSAMTAEMAELLQCTRPAETANTPSYQSCRL